MLPVKKSNRGSLPSHMPAPGSDRGHTISDISQALLSLRGHLSPLASLCTAGSLSTTGEALLIDTKLTEAFVFNIRRHHLSHRQPHMRRSGQGMTTPLCW